MVEGASHGWRPMRVPALSRGGSNDAAKASSVVMPASRSWLMRTTGARMSWQRPGGVRPRQCIAANGAPVPFEPITLIPEKTFCSGPRTRASGLFSAETKSRRIDGASRRSRGGVALSARARDPGTNLMLQPSHGAVAEAAPGGKHPLGHVGNRLRWWTCRKLFPHSVPRRSIRGLSARDILLATEFWRLLFLAMIE